MEGLLLILRKMENKILIFGNPLIKKDSIALKIAWKLKEKFSEIEFKEIDSTEDLEKEGRNLKIIDVVEGINKVKRLTLASSEDYNRLLADRIYSMHDFDLGYNLRLLKKMNLIDRVEIICIPQNVDEKTAFNQIQLILRKWVAQLMQGS